MTGFNAHKTIAETILPIMTATKYRKKLLLNAITRIPPCGAGIFILHLDFLIRFIISLFIFSAFYRIRFFGAGDIKLFSLIIGFLGIYDGINMSVISLVLAGVGSLVYLIFSAQLITRFNILLNYCTRVLASGQVEKYSEYKLRDKHMIPVAPCFLAGFILWRCFC